MREKMNSAEAVGVAIQLARRSRDITGTELADKVSDILGEHYSANTISKMENGYREPTITELRAIAQALNWPFEWLATPPLPAGLWSPQYEGLGGYLSRHYGVAV